MNRALAILVLGLGMTVARAEGLAFAAPDAGDRVLPPGDSLASVEAALAVEPDSPLLARDLAIAYARAGRIDDALIALDRARLLGDVDPEVDTFRAVLLARAGRRREALIAVRAADAWAADLVGASLGDTASALRARPYLDEDSSRSGLSALVLSAHAGERGAPAVSRLLAEEASERAKTLGDDDLREAARALARRIEAEDGLRTAGRVRASVDHATNPFYAAGRVNRTALRLGLTGEAVLAVPVGRVRIESGLRVDQHLLLTDRATYRELDLTALSLYTGFELPIGSSPGSARFGIAARGTDVFGDLFGVHYATAIEGGPYLVLPIGAALVLQGGVFGQGVDFIDRSPSDREISSQNRDRVGQRATLALSYAFGLFDTRIEGAFLHDDALGDAFDAVGGIVAGRVRARPGGGVVLSTGLAIMARDFGPVGEAAIIGPAATRTEVRTAVELGARVPLSRSLAWIVEDVWVRNNARKAHQYTENVLSLGVEATW